MSTVLKVSSEQIKKEADSTVEAAIIIIGAGPVGVRFVKELLDRGYSKTIILFGAENTEPYNRVQLTNVMMGITDWEDIHIPLPDDSNLVYFNRKIILVNPDAHTVTDAHGNTYTFEKLVIATGSNPHIPTIENGHISGIYKFRDYQDIQKLEARTLMSRNTIVVGGGLLGLEAARAMNRRNVNVTLIDHMGWLMNRNLDEEASHYIEQHLQDLNIKTILGGKIKRFIGEYRVKAVELDDGQKLLADTVILATGIIPETKLGSNAGIAIGRGIKVDDSLETSRKDIYALGECAEHNGEVYGLVSPGFEQAAVLADRFVGGSAAYMGSIAATKLKVLGCDVFSMGEVGDKEPAFSIRSFVYKDEESGVYRRILLRGRILIGVIAVGEWQEAFRIQEVIRSKRKIWFYQLNRFQKTGDLWPPSEDQDVSAWPDSAVICNCTGVTKSRINKVINKVQSAGCSSYACVQNRTGASTVCGACKPVILQMLGNMQPAEPVKAYLWLLVTGLLSLLLASLVIEMPVLPMSESVQSSWYQVDALWRDGLYKQVSGFSLLGLSIVAILVSLRKRVKWFSVFSFDFWRLFHTFTGFLLVILLIAHTGFSFGENLNRYLMSIFIGIALLGAMSSMAVGSEHHSMQVIGRKIKPKLIWAHILISWPLPALLSFHVLSVYYY